MRARVDGFLRACERSRFEPHFVIDAGWKSEEAGRKWTERREKEVRGGRRDIPLSADTFLADALHASGAKVYTVEGTDGDDVIARLAHELSASEPGAPSALVLSADRDMFRYDDLIPNAPERVFADFSFLVAAAAAAASDVSIELHPSPNPTPKPGVVRRAASDVPAYDPVEWTRRHDKLREVLRKGEYVRGACSPLTRAAGNLHGIARPLRARAAYAAMGAADAVREAYPEWDEASGRVRWVDDRVAPFDAAGEETAPSEASEASEASCSAADALLLAAALADVEGAGPANALAWLDARDERGRGIGATAREDVRGFRAFARVALVAETRRRRSQTGRDGRERALAHLLRLRTAANADGTESSSDDTTRSGALLAFPPTNRVMSARAVCAEASCRASFCVSSSEREYLEKKGFDLPRRCRPCRDERKKRNDGRPRGFEPGSWRRGGYDTSWWRDETPRSRRPRRVAAAAGGAPTTATPFATRPRTLPPPRAGGGRGRGRGRDAGGRGAASDAREAAATPDALADALAATSVNE